MSNSALSFFFYWTLSGSVFYLFNLLFRPLEKWFLSPVMRNRILRVNLLIFLLPIPVFVYHMRNLLSRITDVNLYSNPFSERASISSYVSLPFHTDEYIFFSEKNNLLIAIILFWLAGIFFRFSKYFISYYCFRKRAFSSPGIQKLGTTTPEYRLYCTACQNLKIHHIPEIFVLPNLDSPFTSGIFKHKIYIPLNWEISSEVYEIVLRHELTHIKRRDLFFKFLASVVIMLHWYNPFSYLLFFSLDNSNELTADMIALRGQNSEAQKQYGILLLSLCTPTDGIKRPYSSGVIYTSKHFFKERIWVMKNLKKFKNSFCKSLLFCALLLVSIGVSSVSVLGYNPLILTTDELAPLSSDTEIFFYTDSPELLDFTDSDIIFIDDLGKVYTDISSRKSDCKHVYSVGKIATHTKDGNGGCIVRTYEAKHCSKCGNTLWGDLLSSTTFKVCPHK